MYIALILPLLKVHGANFYYFIYYYVVIKFPQQKVLSYPNTSTIKYQKMDIHKYFKILQNVSNTGKT